MAEMQGGVRFELDVRAERAATRLRMSAALLVICAGAWLLALPFVVPRALAVAGLVFSALWITRTLRERRRMRNPADHYLELAADRLRLRDGERLDDVPWPDVESVSVDEDRLLLRVGRRSGPALEIEPRYRGAGLYDLFEAVKRAHAGANPGPSGAKECVPPLDG